MIDPIFTNGVIAVKERLLLGEKLLRFCEMTAEEVLRSLRENGFGSGAETNEGEALCRAEEAALDQFIREYAPGKAELSYLLSPRDFHNAKALCKAKKLGTNPEKLLAPEGLVPISVLEAAVDSGDTSAIGGKLAGAVTQALEGQNLTGAEIGGIFDVALYGHLSHACRHSRILKKLLAGRADRTNILTAMRSADSQYAQKLYVGGGIVRPEKLQAIFSEDEDTARHALDKTPYAAFYGRCYAAKSQNMPFTEGERELESCEAEYFFAKRYELEGKQPFLYYVFRRRAEIQNVRIILVCLNAGLTPREIRLRLRAV